MRIAAATPSPSSLEAAFEVAGAGGSAVDAAVAAAVTAMVQEIGICSPAGGGFVTVGGSVDPVTYDGYVAVPGIGRDPSAPATEHAVTMDYGGGITTIVGPGSIATPGVWRALEAVHADHGQLGWDALLAPAMRSARHGFTLGAAVFTYLRDSHRLVFGEDEAISAVIHGSDGQLIGPGELVRLPDLATTLEEIAASGAAHLHEGDLGDRVAGDLARRGSRLTREDLRHYRAERRQPIGIELGDFSISTNPAPAVGGAALVALLELLPADPGPDDHLRAQWDVFGRRLQGDPLRSGSTIHVSVVDEDGLACALTASSGYGSGVVPAGTGLMMNNALGELELVGDGRMPAPGERMISNMAPSVVRSDAGEVLAVGSPGASRITSALAQVLAGLVLGDRDLQEAVTAPRLHVEPGEPTVVSSEPGISLPDDPLPGVSARLRRFGERHMYFGGVGVARRSPEGELMAVADPRREGAAGVSAPRSRKAW